MKFILSALLVFATTLGCTAAERISDDTPGSLPVEPLCFER